jgi:hypothetical protein
MVQSLHWSLQQSNIWQGTDCGKIDIQFSRAHHVKTTRLNDSGQRSIRGSIILSGDFWFKWMKLTWPMARLSSVCHGQWSMLLTLLYIVLFNLERSPYSWNTKGNTEHISKPSFSNRILTYRSYSEHSWDSQIPPGGRWKEHWRQNTPLVEVLWKVMKS